MSNPRKLQSRILRLYRALSISLLLCIEGLAAGAQESLTLQQAIIRAIEQSPEVAIARADNQEAKSAAEMARSQLLPQLDFTEDISRGNDPVYVFGTRLRQRQFHSSRFCAQCAELSPAYQQLLYALLRTWVAFDSFKTQKEIHRADLFRAKRVLLRQSSRPADRVSSWSRHTSQCSMRNGKSTSHSMNRRLPRHC